MYFFLIIKNIPSIKTLFIILINLSFYFILKEEDLVSLLFKFKGTSEIVSYPIETLY